MININLLPPELKMKRIAAKRNASLVGICVVFVLAVIILGVIGKSLESTVQAYLGETKNTIEKNSSVIDQYKDLQDLALLINDRWKTTQEIDKDRVYWSQVLQDLINCVPTDVQFENVTIKMEKTPNFVLQGNTTTEREIIKFKEKLEDSIFFKNVTFKSSSLAQGQTQTLSPETNEKLNFTLEFDLEQKKVEASVSGANIRR